MKYIFTIIILIIFLANTSCSDVGGKATPEELALAADTGRKMAEEALSYPAGSMVRENAILSIRAKETELRMAGFEACADTFASVAGKIILDNL